MTTIKTTLLGLSAATAFFMPVTATAQQKERPPKPEFGKMAASIGVSEAALKACMPAPKNGPPERINEASLTSCLQAENGSIDEAAVGKMLKKFRPKRPSK